MRLVAVETATGLRVALVDGSRLLDAGVAGDVGTLVREGGVPVAGAELHGVTVRPPLQPGKIVAVGLNYTGHVRETGRAVPEQPVIFAKWPSSILAHDECIVIPRGMTTDVDWEGELAVVVGGRLHNSSEAEALDAVFGYTIANDVTARDVQRIDGQWTRAKSFDTFGPVGPVVVTPDEIHDVQALRIMTRVNGEVVQEASTAEMIFDVGQVLAFCSRSFPLEPGDLVLTGTPWGCGAFMSPPRSLSHGDEVEVEIDGIGVLRNLVIDRVVAEVAANA